jgi:hypothetical protein
MKKLNKSGNRPIPAGAGRFAVKQLQFAKTLKTNNLCELKK